MRGCLFHFLDIWVVTATAQMTDVNLHRRENLKSHICVLQKILLE